MQKRLHLLKILLGGVWNFEDGQAVLRVRTELMNALLPLILLY